MTKLKFDNALIKPLLGVNSSAFIVPFITVAREPGSGGAPIAAAVAKKLNFQYLNEQIIDEVSKSTQKRKAIIQAVDEKTRTKIEDIIHSNLNAEYIDDVKYMTELTKVILAYAVKGRVVILGRGANFITPFGKGLHVNIIAPYEVRVKRAMDFEGFTRAQAEAEISRVEKQRKEFVRQYLKMDASKANSYDLTINTQYFRVEEARDIIIEAFYQKFSRSTRYLSMLKG